MPWKRHFAGLKAARMLVHPVQVTVGMVCFDHQIEEVEAGQNVAEVIANLEHGGGKLEAVGYSVLNVEGSFEGASVASPTVILADQQRMGMMPSKD